MAAQIAPDLEESIKDFIAKTMKEAKRESKPILNKQVSKEENTTLTTNFPEYSENTTNKPASNENIMEIEEEKAPLKPSSSKNLSLPTNSMNEAANTKKRSSVVEFEDIKKIENLLK